METKNEVAIIATELKQPQTVLDLDKNEDAKITLVYNKYERNEKAPIAAQIAAANKLVSPEEKRVEALCKFATTEAYQAAKAAELAKGNYLTSQLRTKIVGIMQGLDAFAELSAKDCFERWMTGYKDKTNEKRRTSALKLLDRARAAGEEFSDL